MQHPALIGIARCALDSAGVAQLVERNLAKVDVAGSNPVSRSILLRRSISK